MATRTFVEPKAQGNADERLCERRGVFGIFVIRRESTKQATEAAPPTCAVAQSLASARPGEALLYAPDANP